MHIYIYICIAIYLSLSLSLSLSMYIYIYMYAYNILVCIHIPPSTEVTFGRGDLSLCPLGGGHRGPGISEF